jgi:hypothetical protein
MRECLIYKRGHSFGLSLPETSFEHRSDAAQPQLP